MGIPQIPISSQFGNVLGSGSHYPIWIFVWELYDTQDSPKLNHNWCQGKPNLDSLGINQLFLWWFHTKVIWLKLIINNAQKRNNNNDGRRILCDHKALVRFFKAGWWNGWNFSSWHQYYNHFCSSFKIRPPRHCNKRTSSKLYSIYLLCHFW